MIDHYEFGRIILARKTYDHDIMILPDRTVLSWWRIMGHNVENKDLEEIYKHNPDLLILGTGASGVMQVSREVRDFCRKNNIRLVIEKTDRAVEIYNQDPSANKAAGFHLTC